jgi:hypothetical protein
MHRSKLVVQRLRVVVVDQHEFLANGQLLEEIEEDRVSPLGRQIADVDRRERVVRERLPDGHVEFAGLRVGIRVLPAQPAVTLDLIADQVDVEVSVGRDRERVAGIGPVDRIEEALTAVRFPVASQIDVRRHPAGVPAVNKWGLGRSDSGWGSEDGTALRPGHETSPPAMSTAEWSTVDIDIDPGRMPIERTDRGGFRSRRWPTCVRHPACGIKCFGNN